MKIMFTMQRDKELVEDVKNIKVQNYENFLAKYKKYKDKAIKMSEPFEHIYSDVFFLDGNLEEKILFNEWKLKAQKFNHKNNMKEINKVLLNIKNNIKKEKNSSINLNN